MKIRYLLSLSVILCVSCTTTKPRSDAPSSGLASQALDIESEVFDIGNARNILGAAVQKAKQRLAMAEIPPCSVEGLSLIHGSLKEFGFTNSYSRGTFHQSLISRGLDCSDFTLVYLEIAHEYRTNVGVVFAPNHIMIALKNSETPVFWETLRGRVRSPLEYLTNNAISEKIVTKGTYLTVRPSEDSLAPVYIEVGIKLQSQGKHWQAEAFLWRSVVKHPQCVNAWFGLGGILAARGSYLEAEHALKEALELDPNYTPAIKILEMLGQASVSLW